MSFFDFVEQNDGVRTAANLFGELATFFVADVAGRRSDETGDVVFLHVFGHVDADERLGVAEHELGDCFGE